MVIGTNFIGSCKSNYHTITTTATPIINWKPFFCSSMVLGLISQYKYMTPVIFLYSIQIFRNNNKLVLQLTKIYLPLPTSVQPISITKTLLIVPIKNERGPPLFTGKLLIKFQNILRNTTQVIIRHRVKILFSVISSPITLERQK